MSTRAKVAVTYVTVLALMLVWWSALKASESVGPILLVAVAYSALTVTWLIVRQWGRSGQERSS